MKTNLIQLLLVFEFLAVPACARAEATDEANWRWIWVRPRVGIEWSTLEGTTQVKINGNNFGATLRGVSGTYQPTIHLVGTLTGGKAVASGDLLNSDAGNQPYLGEVWQANPSGYRPGNGRNSDLIVLLSGPNYIGLYRDATRK